MAIFADDMALIALGGNLHGRWGAPERTLARAMRQLADSQTVHPVRLSRLWRSAPYGGLRQPAFVNAVALVRTSLSPHALLKLLAAVERAAGRRRGVAWGARTLDLDLIDHAGRIVRPCGAGRLGGAGAQHRLQRKGLILPHPGLRHRVFVLLPLAEVRPDWRHPATGETMAGLLAQLPAARASCRPLRAQPEEWAGLRSHFQHHGDFRLTR